MTLGQFRKLFEAAEALYRESGNQLAARSLRGVSTLFAGSEAMTVANFSKMLANVARAGAGSSRVSGAMKLGELSLILQRLQDLYVPAGATGAVKDLKAFLGVLEPYAETPVDSFCENVKNEQTQGAVKTKGRRKSSGGDKSTTLNEGAIALHVTQLRNSGANRQAFESAFAELKADKTIKAADVAEIARQYADSVTKYKSVAAAHTDISKAFVRQARFENKLR